MTGYLGLLTNVQDIVPIPVELPLDIKTFAVKKGTMQLTDNTFLSNVVIVPKMQCPLILIKCLMKDLNFSVNFIDGKCLIHDRVMRTMIGTGEEQGGVFLFKEAEQSYANRVKVDDDFELWHRRLGHPIPEGCFRDVSPDVAFVSIDNVGNENAQSLESDSFETHDLSENDIGESVAEPPILSNTSGGNDFVTHFARYSSSKDPAPVHPVQSTSSCTRYPIANYVTCSNLKFFAKYRAFLALVTSSSEPTRYSQAVKEKNWCDAMKAEIDALESNGPWELVTLPPGKKAIGCKWVYKTKYISDGTVERHKARLVIYGNKQREDIGSLRYFLGLEIARSKEGIYLCQRKYALDIIAESGLLGCKPASFSMDENHNLALATGPLLKEPKKYCRLVERLIYLTISRPELSYCVHILAQFMKTPLEVHWESALRVVKYLKGPMKLFCDSQAIHIATNPVFHERTKHIEVDRHFIRDEVQSRNIVTKIVRTTEQLADIFTKALGKQQFHYILSKLSIRNLHAST
ncbi:retrovirus-related pol polyprotein from transposon RE2 [Tanacetum coccineum]|uniref:Retrovirus-related pol polyprotein from transposon RE2 n=1 Tax=Tanacetum coccineum TaxID=301880 RepID=A0ABQ5G4U6_9ASTR